MKIFQKLMLLTAVGAMSFLYSCGEEEPVIPPAPSLSVSASVNGANLADGGEVEAGDTIAFSVNVTAAAGFNTLYATGAITETWTRTDLGLEAGATEASVEFMVGTSEVGTGTIEFEAVDEENQNDTLSFVFVVVEPPSPTAKTQTAVMLYAPTGDLTSETFYSIASNETYSRDEVESTSDPISETIDFGYYYGANDGASLASPAEYPIYDLSAWGTLNETVIEYTDLDQAGYLEIETVADVTELVEAQDLSNSNGVVGELAEGDVLVYEQADGTRGLIIVNGITGEDGSDGFIELELKLAEAAQD